MHREASRKSVIRKLISEEAAVRFAIRSPQTVQLGGVWLRLYEVTGEFDEVRLHYRKIMLEMNDYFCTLVCWTTPVYWRASQPKFEELVSKLSR